MRAPDNVAAAQASSRSRDRWPKDFTSASGPRSNGWSGEVAVEGVRLSAFRSLTPQLLRARVAGLRQYGALVSRYVAMMLVAACLAVVPLLLVEPSAHEVIERLVQVLVGKVP